MSNRRRLSRVPFGHLRLPVTLSMGMGVDSAAILFRWLLDPSSRDFDLEQLTVVTAMTGDESKRTKWAMETFLLPLMREHGVRYVQVARAGHKFSDGIDILSDSDETKVMIMRGKVTLAEHMRLAGTIPQFSNRKCSYAFKGWVLDTWAAQEYDGASRRHVIGYATEENRRRLKDVSYSAKAPGKDPWYPLFDWGWDRKACEDYLREVTGIEWPRSCCGFCPFQAGPEIDLMADRWRAEPEQAYLAVELEAVAKALNDRQTLFRDRSAADLARSFGLDETVEAALAEVAGRGLSVYEVRRIYRRRGDHKGDDKSWQLGPDPMVRATQGSAVWRSLRTVADGTADELAEVLLDLRRKHGGELDAEAGRLLLRSARAPWPSREHYFTVGPSGVPPKELAAFESLWEWVDGLGLEPAPQPAGLVVLPQPRRRRPRLEAEGQFDMFDLFDTLSELLV